jgi:molybdate transport system regulatory protein
MKTSARNKFVGKVSGIRTGMILTEVELTTASGLKVVSVITNESMESLALVMGSPVTATIKAPWVILIKEEHRFKTSARNKFPGKISKVNEGQIAAEVVVDLADGTKVTSLITDVSVKALDLKVGDEVYALVKAFSVILNVD